MGTNYYAMLKVSTETIEKIKAAADRNDMFAVRDLTPTPIHIGKSSGGWQFCFNHNDWQYFEPNRGSIGNFLRECIIRDEYGKFCSYEEFWKMVAVKCLDKIDAYGTIHDNLFFSKWTEFS